MLSESYIQKPIVQKASDQSLGFYVHSKDQSQTRLTAQRFVQSLHALGAQQYLTIDTDRSESGVVLHVRANLHLCELTPDYDTTLISGALGLDISRSDKDLDLEIVLALARSPFPFVFPSIEEFEASVRTRRNVVRIATDARISFGTGLGEVRPTEFFNFHPDSSFTLIPGVSLIHALSQAINPPNYERAYSFSCYRASEYVMALALARELEQCHPAMLEQMQGRWMYKPIMSKEFHEVLLLEYGSLDDPVPMKFYVPGERVWFKNPDERSSDVIGFEGSWVCYIGAGLFNNFWKSNEPFTLQSKCLEIYHWRHGVELNQAGELCMNEDIVEHRVRQSCSLPGEVDAILDKMLRFRDPSGVYDQGGCIDASREHLRWVVPSTTNICIPPVKLN